MKKSKLAIYVISLSTLLLGSQFTYSQDIISAEDLVNQLGVAQSRSLGSQSFSADQGRANMSAIQFEYNSAELTESGRKQVDELATAIKHLDQDVFEIIGHTDASGSDSYNLMLSQRRANTVHTYLIEKHGIHPSRLNAVGKGEAALVNSQQPNASENRRVEAVNAKVLN